MTMNPDMEMAEAVEAVEAVARFCAAWPCYSRWPAGILRQYVTFHVLQGTFCFVRRPRDRAILGTGVAWRCNEVEILAGPEQFFAWQPDNPQGDSLFLGTFIGAERGVVNALAEHFAERFPAWPRLKVFTYRRSRLVRLKSKLLKTLIGK